MRTKNRRRRRASVEVLEPRLVLSARPPAFPGTPLELPQGGSWTETPFIGSPVVADLNNDGRDEILTAAAGGRLIAYTTGPDGRLREFRRYETGATSDFKSTPIVVPRPNGSKIVVAGLSRDEFSNPGSTADGRVYAWDAVTGQVLPGWPRSAGVGGVTAPLTAGDLTGDGAFEIVAISYYGDVSAFRQDGSLLWRFRNDDTIISGAVIGDLDRDGSPEVVFGSDISDNPFFRAGGFVNVLNANGAMKYRIPTPEVIWSSPVLADLTGDGFLEIVVGTGLHFSLVEELPPDRKAVARHFANQVLAYDHQGRVLPGWPYRTWADGSANRQVVGDPAVGDLTGDGRLEVVAVDFAGYVHVVRGDGRPLPGFEGGRRIAPAGWPTVDTFSSPIIADVDGDGFADIIVSTDQNLVAMDRSGRRIWEILAPSRPGGPPDGHANAAAIGQLDGVGGLELVTATTVYGAPNPPRGLAVYRLPESRLTPPWPMHRKTPTGQAVSHSPTFLDRYVRATFRALLEREAQPSDLVFFPALIQENRWTPKTLADTVARTPESRSVVVRKLYDSYLQRPPTAAEVAAGLQRLSRGTAEELAMELVTSPESLAKTDGSIRGVLDRLYRTILRRPIAPQELAHLEPHVRAGSVTYQGVARALLRSEHFVLHEIAIPTILAYRTEFPDAPFDPAGVTAVINDRAAGRREEHIRAGLIASGGRYERTSPTAALVRSVYDDLLMREAQPTEVAAWLRALARGTTTPQFVAAIVDSPEARALYVRQLFRELLGREADAGAVAALSGYASREDLKHLILTSDEYYRRGGGTNAGFVRAVFRDLYGFDPLPEPIVAEHAAALNQGRQTRSGLVRTMLGSEPAMERTVVRLLTRYIPAEDKGVLRVPIEAPPGTPPNNPDPGLIRHFVAAMQAGATEADIVRFLLGTSIYQSKAAYVRGLYRSEGIRY